MPAIDRAPDPRAKPSRTVSAWSSAVWPSRTVAGGREPADSPPSVRAARASAAYRAAREAASGPPGPRRAPEASVTTRAGSAPSPARRSRVARASSGESCLHPWSTVRLAASTPAREATKSAAWASAMESEPPETASRTREPASIPASRKADSTALRVSASAR